MKKLSNTEAELKKSVAYKKRMYLLFFVLTKSYSKSVIRKLISDFFNANLEFVLIIYT